MNYENYRSLLKPHHQPLQLENKTIEEIELLKGDCKDQHEEPVWDTILCNALYMMYSQPLIFTCGGKTPRGAFSSLELLPFFKNITKFRDPINGEIFYKYELSDKFKNDSADYFSKSNATPPIPEIKQSNSKD